MVVTQPPPERINPIGALPSHYSEKGGIGLGGAPATENHLRCCQEGEEIGHFIRRNLVLEAFGHGGAARRSEGFELAAEERGFEALLGTEGDRARSFGGEDAGFDEAIRGDGGVFGEAAIDGAVGVEDFAEQAFAGFILAGGEVRADLVADAFHQVARGAVFREDGFAALDVAFVNERARSD